MRSIFLKHKGVVFCLALIMYISISLGIVSTIQAQEAEIVLVASHAAPSTHELHKAFVKMDEVLRSKSDGRMKLDIYSDASLADEVEALEALQMGTIDITSLSVAPVTSFVKEFMACDIPYIFKNISEAHEFYDGQIGDILFEKAQNQQFIGLAWWENGFRHITNNVRPIRTPNDVKGLKIRTMQCAVHIETMRTLGASPVPVSFGELYSALQQGVVDGQENPLTLIRDSKFYEVQKYLTLSKHFYDPSPLFISKKTWGKLTTEQKEMVQSAANEARDYMRNLISNAEEKAIQALESEGMQVTRLSESEFQAFQEATAGVADKFRKEIGEEFLDQFMKEAK